MSKLEHPSSLKYLIHEDLYLMEEDLLVDNEQVSTSEAPFVSVEAKVTLETKPEEALVVPVEENAIQETKTEVVSEPEVSYTKRTNQVLIVFNNPNADALPEVQKAYLEKILGAVKLQLGSVDMINCSLETVVVAGYEKVISFTDQYTPPVTSKYKVEEKDACKMLLADDLSTISISTVLRKQLWGALQQMFPV